MAAPLDVDPRVRAFSFAELQRATDDFRDRIGSGATGEVFSGEHDGASIAVKRLNLPAGSSPQIRARLRRRFLAELHALAGMQHVRLVHLKGYAVDDTEGAVHPFALVYELLAGGSLADWLKGAAGEAPARPTIDAAAGAAGHAPIRCTLSALQRIDVALGAAAGIAFLHGQEEPADDGGPHAVPFAAGAAAGGAGGAGGVPAAVRQVTLHRDIKAANIGLGVLAGGALHAKLLDFGLARAVRGDAAPPGAAAAAAAGTFTSLGAGTPGYVAPELANTGPSVQTDIYAFGVVLLELLSGQRAQTAVVSRLLQDAEEAGTSDGAALVAAHAEAGMWPNDAMAALSQLIGACTRVFPRRRLPSIADAISRLRDIRAMLEPAAITVMCDACMEEFPAGDVITCPPPAVRNAGEGGGLGAEAGAGARAGAGAGAGGAFAEPEGQRHSICLGCLQRHVATVEAIAIDMNGGRVPCACPGCASPGWALETVIARAGEAVRPALAAKLVRLEIAARSKRATEAAKRDKIARGLQAAAPWDCRVPAAAGGAGAAGGEVGGAAAVPVVSAASIDIAVRAALLADVIREHDLTLRCPRCAIPYAEASGCNAVLCGSRDLVAGVDVAAYGCGARFCGVCCKQFPTASANHAHHETAHGDYMDKVLRVSCELALLCRPFSPSAWAMAEATCSEPWR